MLTTTPLNWIALTEYHNLQPVILKNILALESEEKKHLPYAQKIQEIEELFTSPTSLEMIESPAVLFCGHQDDKVQFAQYQKCECAQCREPYSSPLTQKTNSLAATIVAAVQPLIDLQKKPQVTEAELATAYNTFMQTVTDLIQPFKECPTDYLRLLGKELEKYPALRKEIYTLFSEKQANAFLANDAERLEMIQSVAKEALTFIQQFFGTEAEMQAYYAENPDRHQQILTKLDKEAIDWTNPDEVVRVKKLEAELFVGKTRGISAFLHEELVNPILQSLSGLFFGTIAAISGVLLSPIGAVVMGLTAGAIPIADGYRKAQETGDYEHLVCAILFAPICCAAIAVCTPFIMAMVALSIGYTFGNVLAGGSTTRLDEKEGLFSVPSMRQWKLFKNRLIPEEKVALRDNALNKTREYIKEKKQAPHNAARPNETSPLLHNDVMPRQTLRRNSV